MLKLNLKSIFIFIYQLLFFLSVINAAPYWEQVQTESIDLLQKYIQIDTSNPPADVTKAIKWLAEICEKNNSFSTNLLVSMRPRPCSNGMCESKYVL